MHLVPKRVMLTPQCTQGKRGQVSNARFGGKSIHLGRLNVKIGGVACTEFRKIDEKRYNPRKMRHIWEELARHNRFGFGPKDMEEHGATYRVFRDGKLSFTLRHCLTQLLVILRGR